MAFVTGILLIDAPASALNNLGIIQSERTENSSGVKVIRTREQGSYPYVSAQAFRYWLRTTAEKRVPGWQPAPIYRADKIAYTDANPLQWWDDDLLGYMRAFKKPTKEEKTAKEQGANGTQLQFVTDVVDTVKRVSPFRVSTLASIAPVVITSDFGAMTRQEGYPVLFEHQFYRTTLQGLFSLDLHDCGTFSYRGRSGSRNLDEIRIAQAKEQQLEHLEDEKAYRLSLEERIKRIQGLFEAMALLEGGAKQAIHYTDVAPAFCLFAVTRGGNHIFGRIIGAKKEQPEIKIEALREALTTLRDEILSPVYIGWARGYMDEQREAFEKKLEDISDPRLVICHPRDAYRALVSDFAASENALWLR